MVACGETPATPPYETVESFRYVDLLAGQDFRFVQDSGQRVEALCGGQTYTSAVWTAEERLEVEIPEGFDRARIRFCSPDLSQSTISVDFRLEESLSEEDARDDVSAGGDFRTNRWFELELETTEPAHRLIFEILDGFSGPLYFSDLVVETRRHEEELSTNLPASVLLISLDTLRADALGVYMPFSSGSNTPHLDALAAESQVFDRHYASAHWTKPSHATLLTGLPNEIHQAFGDEGGLSDEIFTLAERFQGAEYTTGALVEHIWLGEKFGFAQGFRDFRLVNWQTDQMRRSVTNWLWDQRHQKTFFFWHVMDAHSDFRLLPYESRDTDAAWIEERFGAADYGCREGHCASFYLNALDQGRLVPLEEEPEILAALYHRGVADLDRELGRLITDLKKLGLWDSLTVVITSDHGEEFGGQGRFSHWGPAEPILQVPLMIKWPVKLGRINREKGPSSSLDLAPTLLAEHGIEASDLPGAHLLHRPARQPIIASAGNWSMVIQADEKLLMGEHYPEKPLTQLSSVERYREQKVTDSDAVERLTALRARYLAEIQKQLVWEENTVSAALTEEEKEKLEALGYISP